MAFLAEIGVENGQEDYSSRGSLLLAHFLASLVDSFSRLVLASIHAVELILDLAALNPVHVGLNEMSEKCVLLPCLHSHSYLVDWHSFLLNLVVEQIHGLAALNLVHVGLVGKD